MIMKKHFLTGITTLAAIFSISAAASADQYRPAGDDGISASPRLRKILDERKASVTVAAPAMACRECADFKVATTNPHAKGAERMTGTKQISYIHACRGCETKMTVAGEGKAKHTVATHKCAASTSKSLACCASR